MRPDKFRIAAWFAVFCSTSCARTDAIPLTTALESAVPPYVVGRSCFAGKSSSYDEWTDSVADRATFQSRFPREEYERYRRDLDCHAIEYPVDGLNIRGFYVRPKVAGDGRLPVIIVNRGGNGPSGAWNLKSLFQRALPLAEEGFAVIGSQYRGSRRHADVAIDGRDEFGGQEVNDVLALFDLIDRMPELDATRIGMLGWSRGGFMAFLVARRTDRLSALAVGGTPTDLAAELRSRPEMERVFRARIPDHDANREAALAARSAALWAADIDPDLPILILHGSDDKRVTPDSARNMADELERLGHPHKLVIYEGGSHGLLEHKDAVRRELSAWFGGYLTSGTPHPLTPERTGPRSEESQ
jgi:dipeptidyl aminopeptidase/acylaminoacyl peptidase